jgi:hypothetical protein
MSEVKEYENVMTLEDLFLSHEFGKTAVATPSAVQEKTLFGGTPPRPLMVPRVVAPAAVGGHASTTHLRRNRMVATVSGVAAALLIAVGLVSGTGKAGKSGVQTASPPTSTPSGNGKGGSGQSGGGISTNPGSGTNPTGGQGSGGNSGEALGRHSAETTGTAAVLADETVPTPGGGGGHTGPPPVKTAPETTQTAPPADVLKPVVQLVGQVVVTTGNTVSGVSTTLGTALPPITPVTSLVGSVGGTLSGLGDGLITSA